MPLSTFPTDMSAAAAAVIQVADFLRRLRDGSGDLNWSDLVNTQRLLHRAKIASIKAITEGFKAREAAETYMRQINGPVTLEAFAAQLAVVEAAGAAWANLLRDTVNGLPGSAFLRIGAIDEGTPSETAIPIRLENIPAEQSTAIRSSGELAGLIAAFEAAGA